MNLKTKINLSEKIGKGYKTFFGSRCRYRAVKGSRGSKKSTTTAMWFIYNLMKFPLANALVIRQVFNTHKDSTFAQLKWAAHNLGVYHLWNFSKSPLEATYIPTGQKILFRGLDDPMSITSITVEKGFLCWVWFEEAFQIKNEDDFNKIDLSIRGAIPQGYFKQLTLTFNPWSEKHWIKKRFFDKESEDILALTTTYKCNEWLGEDDLKVYETMKKDNPRRYRIEGLGEWGIAEGLIFENFEERAFNLEDIKKIPDIKSAFGLDWGYTNDPSTLFCGMVSVERKEIYVFDEMYKKGMTNEAIAEEITKMGYAKEQIRADSAEPKSIDRLYALGIQRIVKARKGKDSILNGIAFIQNFKIIIHPKCENFITEVNNYIWDEDKFGQKVNKPIDEFNHLMDAMRYALEGFALNELYSWD